MLVLTRKNGESLMLGDEIEIRVVRIEGDQVRIGIVAPRSILIVRGELVEEVERETTAAARPDPEALGKLSRRLLQNAPPSRPAPAPATGAEPANASGKTCRDA